jgi:hypothetical protein
LTHVHNRFFFTGFFNKKSEIKNEKIEKKEKKWKNSEFGGFQLPEVKKKGVKIIRII